MEKQAEEEEEQARKTGRRVLAFHAGGGEAWEEAGQAQAF